MEEQEILTEEQPVEQEVTQQQEQQPEPPKESYQARNFRALREKVEQLERERDEALRLAQQQSPEEPDEELTQVNPDDLLEGKHHNKIAKKIRVLEKKLAQYQQHTYETAAEAKLRTEYPDFDQVVNKDTIQALRDHDPVIAETINSTPNLYNKAVAAYKIIKQFGLAQSEETLLDKERVKQNAAKPRPLASIAPQKSESPLSHANAFANGLTKELKEQLYREMMETRRQI